MNTLHLLSQKYLTGAEVYAVRLAQEQVRNGDYVILVSDTLTVKTDLSWVSLPISKHSYLTRIINGLKVARLCKLEGIELIHAHSRAACWVAYLACKLVKCAYVTTLHDVQRAHRQARAFNIYGENLIAVCEAVKDDVVTNLGIDESHVTVIRNGL